jgi:hypothetical protein
MKTRSNLTEIIINLIQEILSKISSGYLKNILIASIITIQLTFAHQLPQLTKTTTPPTSLNLSSHSQQLYLNTTTQLHNPLQSKRTERLPFNRYRSLPS